MKPPLDQGPSSGKAEALPPQKLAQARSAGMHAIRFEFVVRLLRVEVKMDTMSIFWDHPAAELLDATPGARQWRLVLGRGRRASAEFPDHWVVHYPRDLSVKQQVDAEIDRLVEAVRAQSASALRAGSRHAQPASPAPSPMTSHGRGPTA